MKTSKTIIRDAFFSNYRELVRREMIPYQWAVLNDEAGISIARERNDMNLPNEKSHAIENLKIAAGRTKGHHYGWVFQDSDVYKWLEAVAYSLMEKSDENLQKIADGVVELIADAQEDSGYLSTYFIIEAPDRKFKNLKDSHELYCGGHFLEAAVAYYQATGNELVLKTARKLADFLDASFGPEEGKIHGADGHEEIEIGLMKLYHLTEDEKYLKLARYFLNVRGTDPDFFKKQMEEDPAYADGKGNRFTYLPYFQWHKPVTEQDTAEGHAVRLVYMCTAMADAAAASGDEKLLAACRKIWRNIVDRRMYITGGIGSTVHGESFTYDYDLPNDTMYCETCASCGLFFFADRMLENEASAEYADVMERALYNTVLAGMALDGKHFFYVNPLEVNPESVQKDPRMGHVKSVRPSWLGCACCPPNLARLLTSLDRYIYKQKDNTVYANLFVSSESTFTYEGGSLKVSSETEYPWNGRVVYTLRSDGDRAARFAVRLPGWAKNVDLKVNGAKASDAVIQGAGMYTIENGYAIFEGFFTGDRITLDLDMSIRFCHANPNVRADIGKTAIMRGPLVYCLESVDNGEGLNRLYLKKGTNITIASENASLGSIITLHGTGFDIGGPKSASHPLYYDEPEEQRGRSSSASASSNPDYIPAETQRELKWIPYYAWANRGENEMSVWIEER